jgi:hypothetical protein
MDGKYIAIKMLMMASTQSNSVSVTALRPP